MTILEIVLLILGGVIFILSFLIPGAEQGEPSEDITEASRAEVHRLVAEEMEGIRQHVDGAVDEAIEYAMEKTERSLERLSNEKIMAVSEYSDTVLQEIHKNHEEVMFLYDMLNDKHENITQTVSEVNHAVKAVEVTTKEAQKTVENFKQLVPETVEIPDNELVKGVHTFEPPRLERTEPAQQDEPKNAGTLDEGTANKNEEILRLYRQGKKTVAIAQELGLGVGEVKLVIDLFKNIQS